MRGKRIRHVMRYRVIASTIARYGFGLVSDEIGSRRRNIFAGNKTTNEWHMKSLGERICLLLEELGPTFVKLGQIASTRPDLIPAEILKELETLQDHVQPFPYNEVASIIEKELGAPIESLFKHFSITPLAAASIGQVHRATLKDGNDVVVKIQRPDIQRLIETDLEILIDWARLTEGAVEWAKHYRLREIIEELSVALLLELDYSLEARNTEKFVELSACIDYLYVPNVFRGYSTKRILTTAYIDGVNLSDDEELKRQGLDLKLLAERMTNAIFHQILVEGIFHGDPHPGNVMALPDGRLAMIDFGMIGRLSASMKHHFATFVIALRNQSTRGVIRAINQMGVVPDEVDVNKLYSDVDELREKYYNVPLNQTSIGTAVSDLFNVAYKHRIKIPTELTLLGKCLLTMEGVVTALDPNISIFDIAEPFGKKLLLERLNPKRILQNISEEIPEYIDMVKEIPLHLKQLTRMLSNGRLRIDLESPQVTMLLEKLDRISNRLAFSIVMLALSIVMCGLIIGTSIMHSQSILWRMPVIEIGFVVTIFMFVLLIYSIFRSGRF
ncbi:ABC1 kinase family protein [Paenibacillus endoradicis]|uniref:ABC1 kinase family protein n=1 Tax=Paenibacillus endoradicis TaxID=2972487 RepID=UPI0021599B73|nr:AarF/ABC1/UbiB kinase family protein [Paenibacillus endoradicis]MCR8659602.1 AarF/ABC1/UbiB kinase family protein [Paenibacillus endoradicis]